MPFCGNPKGVVMNSPVVRILPSTAVATGPMMTRHSKMRRKYLSPDWSGCCTRSNIKICLSSAARVILLQNNSLIAHRENECEYEQYDGYRAAIAQRELLDAKFIEIGRNKLAGIGGTAFIRKRPRQHKLLK